MAGAKKPVRPTLRWTTATLALAVAATSVGCNRRKEPKTAEAPAWMEGVVTEQVTSQHPGATPVSPVFKSVAFREDDFERWQVQLEPGYCYYFSGVGDETVDELELRLLDAEDDEVAEEERDDPPKVMMPYCPEQGGSYQLQAKVTDGHGHYLVQVFGEAAGGGAPPPPQPIPEQPAPEPTEPTPTGLAGVIAKEASAAAPDATQIGKLFEGEASQSDWYVALEAGKCYWFIGAADDGVERISLTLFDPDKKKLDDNKSETNQVSLGHCPKMGGMFRFQAKVEAGAGKYAVGVYRAKQK